MGGRPNFNHPFAKAVIDRVKESLVVYQQRMKGVVASVSSDGKSAVVRRYEEPVGIQKKPYINTVAGLQVGDEVVCMVDRGGGVITGVVGGKEASNLLATGTHSPSASPSAWPSGIYSMRVDAADGWIESGVLLSIKGAATRMRQIVFVHNSTVEYHRHESGGLWSGWFTK